MSEAYRNKHNEKQACNKHKRIKTHTESKANVAKGLIYNEGD